VAPRSVRVGSTEPGGRPPAQRNGGHVPGLRKKARHAQNPAYRRTSHFFSLATFNEPPHEVIGFFGAQSFVRLHTAKEVVFAQV